MQPVFISEPAKRFAGIMGMDDKAGKAAMSGLPVAVLPCSQVQIGSGEGPESARDTLDTWQKDHDLAIEIAATSNTLLQLRQYHGSIVQVKVAGDKTGLAHLARLTVATQDNFEFQDGVLYLSPILGFNLGLNLHLESLVQAEYYGSQDLERITSGRHASTSKPNGLPDLPERRKDPKIIVSCLSQPGSQFREIANLAQAGSRPARVGMSDSVTLALVRVPNLQLLNSQTEMDEQEKAAGIKDPHAEEKIEEENEVKPPPFVGEGIPEEAVVHNLQEYLKAKPRLLAVGDIFVIPVTEGTHISGLLKTLYTGPPAAELLYFKVVELKPDNTGTALFVSDRASVILKKSLWRSNLPEAIRDPSSKVSNSTAQMNGHLDTREDFKSSPAIWQRVAGILAPALHPARASVTLRATILISGPTGVGKQTAIQKAAEELGVHVIPFPCQELRAGSDPKTAAALRMAFGEAKEFAPAVLVLKNVDALIDKSPAGAQAGGAENGPARIAAALTDCLLTNKAADEQVLIVGTTSSLPEVPAPIRRCFAHELSHEAPDSAGRADLLRSLLPADSGLSPEAVSSSALLTAGLLPSDLKSAVADSVVAAIGRQSNLDAIIQATQTSDESGLREGKRDNDEGPKEVGQCRMRDKDLEEALSAVQKRTATAVGAPQVPNVKWEDVGGLEDVKGAILETVELPLKHPELFSSGLRRRSGLLLYGPPGTGKTLIAKAVATECSINFLSVKGPELINMYIGESERQVREVFERARRARPCVLFFDELDSLAPARGAGADSGGVMDRVVSQLLAEVDSLAGGGGLIARPGGGSQDVFLIGATNRPDLLDTALMRPGRLDKLLYVGVAQRPEDKLKVLHALTRKFTLAPSVVLTQIAKSCPQTLTGADLYALCADAWMAGLRRHTASDAYADDAEDVSVEQKDFESALATLTPSLSPEELGRYQALRGKYQSL